MRDADCVAFLQWALPRLQLRWPGFRKVRRQVCKRISRRIGELRLGSIDAYRSHLEAHAGEWATLDSLCRITISRFNRDRGVFERIEQELLPSLAARVGEIRCWSIGCASGEEPYTVAIMWRLRVQPLHPSARLSILATDIDSRLLDRARAACYGAGSLKELPAELRAHAFDRSNERYCLRREFREFVELRQSDVRAGMPFGRFDIVLCRNVVFTYFDEALQRQVLARIEGHLSPGGYLVVGRHESLPGGSRLQPWRPGSGIFVLPAAWAR